VGKIKIVADSTCDLSGELIKKYDISILPLNVILGEASYLDRTEISAEEIFEWAERTGGKPKTAATGIDTACSFLERFKEFDTICFTVGANMSASYSVMSTAIQDSGVNAYVIDSQSLSTGVALQMLRAADLAAEGKSKDEIISIIEAERENIRASFVIDTLEYLRRGGRCSALTAFAAGALSIKPRIVVSGGELSVGKKYRGRIGGAIERYIADIEPELRAARPERVFITHTMRGRYEIEMVKRRIADMGYFGEIIETRAGGVIASHCGPNTLGILYSLK